MADRALLPGQPAQEHGHGPGVVTQEVAGAPEGLAAAIAASVRDVTKLRADVVLVQVSPADTDGFHRLGVADDYFADAIDHRFDRIDEEMIFGRTAPLALSSSTSPNTAVDGNTLRADGTVRPF